MSLNSLSSDAKLGLEDLFYFSNRYWGLTLEEKPHRWMCDELMATLSMEETPYLIFDVPRGCYKTSIVTAGAVWQYLRQLYFHDNPYHRLVYASNTLALGKAFLTLIENVLRAGGMEGRIDEDYTPLWKFPDKGDRRTSRREDGIVLLPRTQRGEIASVRDPNFFIASIGALPIGKHADGAILDDLNNKKNVSTPTQLAKTHDFFKQVFPIIDATDRLGNPAHVWMPCTPWHDDDVRGRIIREEQEKVIEDSSYVSPWRVVKAAAHQADGSLFFPTKLSEKKLARLKENMRDEYYAAYEGEPLPPGGSIAEEGQIRWKPREMFPDLRWCRITVDPNQHSDAKVLGCYAAVTAGGYDQFAKLWVTDAKGGRDWDSETLIDELYRMQAEHPSWPIFIEDEHMRHFDHAVNLEFVRRMERYERGEGAKPERLRIIWTPAPRNLSKYERWQNALKPRFGAASIYFAQEIAPSIKAEITEELTRGMSARFKDFLDALSMLETDVIPRYKANGQAQVIPFRQGQNDSVPEKKRQPTWADVLGADRFR